MSILALYQRLYRCRIRSIFLTALITGIHRTVNVGFSVNTCLLILYRARRIELLYPVVGCFEIRPISGLVAKRPYNYAWMVKITLNMTLVTLHMSLGVCFILCQRFVFISHAVAFNIGFGSNIYTITVAKVIPPAVIGVMACTHGIYIQFFHTPYIL